MQEVFEKIIERLRTEKNMDRSKTYSEVQCDAIRYSLGMAMDIIMKAATEYNNGWIPVEDRLPGNEEEVEITFTKKDWMTGKTLYLTARAFYENGTLTTEDSAFGWNDTDNWDIDEDTDTYLIPEGWYEGVSFTEKFEIVDMPVIAWRKLTEPYQPKEE